MAAPARAGTAPRSSSTATTARPSPSPGSTSSTRHRRGRRCTSRRGTCPPAPAPASSTRCSTTPRCGRAARCRSRCRWATSRSSTGVRQRGLLAHLPGRRARRAWSRPSCPRHRRRALVSDRTGRRGCPPWASRTIFLDAAATVADLVARIPGGAWDGPGLGVWDLRALVGHTSRSLVTVIDLPGASALPRSRSRRPRPTTSRSPVRRGANTAAVAAARPRRRAPRSATTPRPPSARCCDDAADALAARGRRRRGADDRRRHARRRLPADPHLRAGRARCATSPPRPGCRCVFAPAVLAEAAMLAARVAVELGRGPVLLAALTGRSALPPGFSMV